MRKLRGKDLYKVINTETKEVKSSGSTKKDAKAQLRLLRGLEKKGGALQADQIKDVIDSSYMDESKVPDGYVLDPDLSDSRVKVYKDLNSDQVIVAHRGSKGWRDWLDNAYYASTGNIRGSSTYKDAKSRQQKAIDKYGANNIISVGHSRAGKYVEELNKEQPVKEVITYNKAVAPHDVFQSNPENQTDVRTSKDVVSLLTPLQFSKNKSVVIPVSGWDLLKSHGTSALGSLGNKLIGKGFKQMRVGDMRKFVKAFKKAKYGEKMTGGAKLGKKELIEMIKPMLEDDDLDELIGGSVWTDFVKEFSSKHDLKYACAMSKYKDPLKKAYKLKKEGKDWFVPLKETTEVASGGSMEGGNKWTDFVKDYAKKYDTTYGCALSDMGTKNAYKLFKDGKEWYFPKTKEIETQTDEFVEPEPTKAPEDIKPVVGRIEDKVKKLEEVGRKKGAVNYEPAEIIWYISFINLLKKYGGKCVVSGVMSDSPLDIGIEVDNRVKERDSLLRNVMIYGKLGDKLKECIDRGVKLIAIPLRIQEEYGGHANMLVYRPFQRLVEHFEPLGGSGDEDVNKAMKRLFEKSITSWIGPVRYKEPVDICPRSDGFQRLEQSIKSLTQEGGGFCAMWSSFLAEMTFLNPDKSTKEIVDEVLDITKKDPEYLRAVIRGYVLEAEQGIDSLLKTLGKTGFSFSPFDPKATTSNATKLYEERKQFDPWILSVIFETTQSKEPQPKYEKLPPPSAKKEKSYVDKLKTFTRKELESVLLLYGVHPQGGTKDDILTDIILGYNTGDFQKRGASGIEDIDRIIAEKLHKKHGAYKFNLAKEGYFTKK